MREIGKLLRRIIKTQASPISYIFSERGSHVMVMLQKDHHEDDNLHASMKNDHSQQAPDNSPQ